MITLALILLAALGLWLALTWYFADNEPLFGPASNERVTFKQVLFNFLDDARHLFDRITNTVFVGVGSLAAFVVANDEVRTVLMQHGQLGLGILFALAMFASPSPRVR